MDAIEGVKNHLLKESEPNKLLYIGELLGGRTFSPKMVCVLSLIIDTVKFLHHASSLRNLSHSESLEVNPLSYSNWSPSFIKRFRPSFLVFYKLTWAWIFHRQIETFPLLKILKNCFVLKLTQIHVLLLGCTERK